MMLNKTENFIRKATERRGTDKFDYSLVKYRNATTPVDIVCKECGKTFHPTPSNFLRGTGCPYCASVKKRKTDAQIESGVIKTLSKRYPGIYERWEFHLDSPYRRNKTNYGHIHCSIHGDQPSKSVTQIRITGCPRCVCEHMKENNIPLKIRTKKDFISKSMYMWGDRFSYPKNLGFSTSSPSVNLVCNKCGTSFTTDKSSHLMGFDSCPVCSSSGRNKDERWFLKMLNILYGDYYIPVDTKFSSVYSDKVTLMCPEHGIFSNTPSQIIYNGITCPRCKGKHSSKTTEEYLSAVRGIGENRYDFIDLQENILPRTRITVRCRQCGRIYSVDAKDILIGRFACPSCNGTRDDVAVVECNDHHMHTCTCNHGSRKRIHTRKPSSVSVRVFGESFKLGTYIGNIGEILGEESFESIRMSNGERIVMDTLVSNHVDFSMYFSPDFISPKSIDFFIPDRMVAIEVQGLQHYRDSFNAGSGKFVQQVVNDMAKYIQCAEHGIKILYFSEKGVEYDLPYPLYTDTGELMEAIGRNSFAYCNGNPDSWKIAREFCNIDGDLQIFGTK